MIEDKAIERLDLRAIVQGHGSQFVRPMDSRFGKIVSFEYQQRYGTKNEDKQITLSAACQTNHVMAYEVKEKPWIQQLWVVYCKLCTTDDILTFKQWKEQVEETRDANGILTLPAIDELANYTRDDLIKFIGSKGKRKVKTIDSFFK